jgi:hypothetical protein
VLEQSSGARFTGQWSVKAGEQVCVLDVGGASLSFLLRFQRSAIATLT